MNVKVSKFEKLVSEFRVSHDLKRIEELADLLGETGDPRAIDSIVNRLGDDPVQADPDVEDALCGALVKLGVMKKLGNLNFHILEPAHLQPAMLATIEKHKHLIPSKYTY